jgi:hypothetical protein
MHAVAPGSVQMRHYTAETVKAALTTRQRYKIATPPAPLRAFVDVILAGRR